MAAYSALLSLAQATDLNKNQDKYLFSLDAEEKIRSIYQYVIFLLQFLEDFPEKAKRWEGEIRVLTHKIEDIIQHFMWCQMQSTFIPMKPSIVKLEDQLKYVTEEIGLISGKILEERPAYFSAAVSPPERSATTYNKAVIGLNDDVIAILERLSGHSFHLQVIPIVGMGGIGKTTLARTIYDHQFILEYFHIRIWLTVSQDYSPHRFGKILLDLVEQLPREKVDGSEEEEEVYENSRKQQSPEMIDESEMASKIYKSLKGWRYLIVIDDVWSTEVWDEVKMIFPDDNNRSRIMLTTRLSDVAAYSDFGNSTIHTMRFMDDCQSWDLLKQKVFTNNDCPRDLEDIGKKIARSCAGLPLVVVLVAGVLSAVNTTKASWEEIGQNVNLVVEEGLEEILSLSYTHLPHHLRSCFLIIGGFPEDANIRASTLIKLWVAEGFLLEHQIECSNKSLEDEAEGYLEDLVKRNLVIATSRKSSNGKIKSCSLHDAVRDLCIRKSHEEKFLQVLDRCVVPKDTMNERRISFSRSNINDIWGPTIRTILCFQLQSNPSWLALLGSSTLLKVLNAIGSKEDLPLPSQVFELFHLRYLAVVGSSNIPSVISNLVNLQTLIIHPTFHPQRKKVWRDYEKPSHFSLPLEIWRMLQLRHIVLYDLYTLPHPPARLNLPLQNLQTLSTIVNHVWNAKMVQMIPNVKRLVLVYSISEECRLHYLKDLLQLEKLQVTGYHDFSWRGQNPSFPCTLKKLTLVGGKFYWEDMIIIGSLPNLQVLKLLNHACVGATWETAHEEFPQLKFLQIDTSHLQQWITHGASPFPRLKCLVLRSCKDLMKIPADFGEIQTLELIEVDNCGKSVVESAKNIKEDQENYGIDTLQVRVVHPDEHPTGEELEDLLNDVTKKFGLIAGEMVDDSPAISSSTLAPAAATSSSSSRHAPTGNDVVIGLHKDLEAMKERLCGKSSNLQIVPIVGVGGIGKTTLARTVYENELIKSHFDIRIWLTVSQDYSPQRFENILLGLADSMKLLEGKMFGDKINDHSEIALRIFQNLKFRRYLVVMDDVWSTDIWDYVRKILPDDNNGSRVMLTTRLSVVAAYPDSNNPLHEMQLMDHSQSWSLLKQKVFTNSNFPPELEDVGKEIVRSCAGVPLAIVLVAGLLVGNRDSLASWHEIAKKLDAIAGIVAKLGLGASWDPLALKTP